MLPSHIIYPVLVARWEPNTKERLVQAALDLFTEQGYDATTVNEIAERAGVSKMTFFRHFPDKREVLFAAGQEIHGRILADAVAAAPDPATPLQAVAAAVDALAATFTNDRRPFAARLRTVVAAQRELQERAASKHNGLAEATTEALVKRGGPGMTASRAAPPPRPSPRPPGFRPSLPQGAHPTRPPAAPHPHPPVLRRAPGRLRRS